MRDGTHSAEDDGGDGDVDYTKAYRGDGVDIDKVEIDTTDPSKM